MGISIKTCEKINTMFAAGYSVKELAEKFDIREGMIRVICNK